MIVEHREKEFTGNVWGMISEMHGGTYMEDGVLRKTEARRETGANARATWEGTHQKPIRCVEGNAREMNGETHGKRERLHSE